MRVLGGGALSQSKRLRFKKAPPYFTFSSAFFASSSFGSSRTAS